MATEKEKLEAISARANALCPGLQSTKKVRRPCAHPGSNLANGWEETPERVEAKAYADRALFTLLKRAVLHWSRQLLYHVIMELARKWVNLATLEEVRAMVIELEEGTL